MEICIGPECPNPVLVKSSQLCQTHVKQQRKGEELRPVNTRKSSKAQSKWEECKHGGCSSTVRSRGFCGRHYRQFLKHGKTWGEGSVGCSVGGCKRPECARSLCEHHYFQANRETWRPHGSDLPCEVEFCDRISGRGRLCQIHRSRSSRFSLSTEDFIRLLGDGSCNACGAYPERGKKAFDIHHDHGCCPKAGWSCGDCVVAYLCGGCNRSAGWVGDDAERLRAIADVIDDPPFRRN